MKKVYMPTMDCLYQMQDMGANVYKYILIKTIETLICYGVNYPNAGILKSTYKYFRENPEIARAICTLYPEEIKYSDVAKMDNELCLRLIRGNKKTNGESRLDYLVDFNSSVLNNSFVLTYTIQALEKELVNNPRYRFEYAGKNELLDRILNGEINEDDFMIVFGEQYTKVLKALINIEPTYAISLSATCFEKLGRNVNCLRYELLTKGINSYGERYGISRNIGTEYYHKDIINDPDQNVKRLMKCINNK